MLTASAFLAWFVVTATLASGTDSGPRVALVIGNQRYPAATPIYNAISDSVAVSESLRRLGFTVTHRTDLTFETFDRELEAFYRRASGAAVAVVYYAGHGIEAKYQPLLLPTDFLASGKLRAIAVNTIMNRLRTTTARVQVVVVDACREGPPPYYPVPEVAVAPAASVGAGESLLVLAAAPGGVASDGNPVGGSGLFTKTMLGLIETADLDLDGLFAQVRAAVASASHGTQVPWITSGLSRPIVLKPSAHSVDRVRSQPVAAVSSKVSAPQEWRYRFVPLPGQISRCAGLEARDSLSMTATEISVADYAQYAVWSRTPMPLGPAHNENWIHRSMPMVNITMSEAAAFCRWIAARLPTYEEFACASANGNPDHYPSTGSTSSTPALAGSARRIAEVGTTAANSIGLLEMMGNVSEWVSMRDGESEVHAARQAYWIAGGSWASDASQLHPRWRTSLPNDRYSTVGFRCVRQGVKQ